MAKQQQLTLAATVIFLVINTLGASFQNLQVLSLVSFSYMVHGFHLLCCGLLNKTFTQTVTGTLYVRFQ
ncbi:hypothetical protein IscW_ISCW015466 [Ixodes scapularis]|uniref:Uncharacterized protein n=1 Tax=Ixodes scapularis TaxID=6945 RepID=B7QNZ3_IXOSC|nr:hypothetical protein IscW_ISCW015466 [Ixodes scapularis]|eukprot:XP_002416648.1 hypothetical protein IscW_ISCW015466 [Ixodes scapularis]